jgi:hypothetical protein
VLGRGRNFALPVDAGRGSDGPDRPLGLHQHPVQIVHLPSDEQGSHSRVVFQLLIAHDVTMSIDSIGARRVIRKPRQCRCDAVLIHEALGDMVSLQCGATYDESMLVHATGV